MFKKENPCDPLAGIHRKETYMVPQKLKLFSAFPDTPEEAPLSILPGITNPPRQDPRNRGELYSS
jgi:hypothetical protein